LPITAEHEVSPEVFIFHCFTRHRESLADAEVNEHELDLVFLGLTGTDILWFQVTMRIAKAVKGLQSRDSLAQHVCGEVDASLFAIDMSYPLGEIAASMCHHNFATFLVYFVPEHERESFEFLLPNQQVLQLSSCTLLSQLLKAREDLDFSHRRLLLRIEVLL